jgi:[ribosomal protein S5]-alanine N-acetyltransferase
MIETERLILRPFTLNDTEKVFQMSNEEGMRKWIPDQVYTDQNEAGEVLEFLIKCYNEPDPKTKPFVLGIELKNSKGLIGHAGLSPIGDGVEIGYAIEEKCHRKGYTTEAIKAMCEYAIEKFNIDKIIAIVARENTGSVKALEKAGFNFIEEKERNAFGRICICIEYHYLKE